MLEGHFYIIAGLSHFLQCQRMLERAGYVDQQHVLARDAEAVELGLAR